MPVLHSADTIELILRGYAAAARLDGHLSADSALDIGAAALHAEFAESIHPIVASRAR